MSDTVTRGLQEAEDVLVTHATSEFDVLRLKAIQGLGALKASSQLSVFIEALKDEDEDVRVDAATALGALGLQDAIVPLLENLQFDPCADVKLACAKSLTELEAAEAKPLFRELAVGRGESIQWDDGEYYQDDWDGWLDIQIEAIRGLGHLRDVEAIPLLMQALDDPEAQNLDAAVCEALGHIGAAALGALGQIAESSARIRRHNAYLFISRIRGNHSNLLMKRAMNDDDPAIRQLAFETMVERKPDIRLYEKAISDESPRVRAAVFKLLKLEEWQLMNIVMKDPSPVVQLALISRFDRKTLIDNKQDVSFRLLDLLMEAEDGEVRAQAFGTLVARAPNLMKSQLETLFAEENGHDPDVERRQWAAVDGLAVSSDEIATDWLQVACHSSSRSVRLKALAALGGVLGDEDLNPIKRLAALEVLLELCGADVDEAFDEPEKQAGDEAHPLDQRDALKAAGLDIGDAPLDEATGPTSSLGAILGHDETADDLLKEAEDEEASVLLTPSEQALLSRATRNISRRKIDLDGDEDKLSEETRITAIHLLGEQAGVQKVLCELCLDDAWEIKIAALSALVNNVERYGADNKAENLSSVLLQALHSANAQVRLFGLRLVAKLDGQAQSFTDSIVALLGDSEAFVRAEAMIAASSLDMDSALVVEKLQDASPLVRQRAMALLSQIDPLLSAEKLFGFLLENPEQSVKAYLDSEGRTREILGSALCNTLRDREHKDAWPVALSALSGLYAQGVPA
ncbi:hypothetical protein E1162_02045 [Rhodobacteraceae bacterium RKSG542]|uniref:HEAT repeat domain-containing protein n=1 Tax=Pseudovibrio flavus TaxID=2529854 RepID=UPI0012BC8A19|nr:HEAT repeat domain-containing protein [Pseudovibrio flavus]MTI16016.1 hypothetical protein [Pseudovibrio flavus]